MFSKTRLITVVSLLSAAFVLLAPGIGAAQHHHGGYHHGGFYYYPSHHYSYSYHYPYYYYPSTAYYPSHYYPNYVPYYTYRPAPTTYQSFYPPLTPTVPVEAERVAHIEIRVPASAKIWFDGVETKQGGTLRTFISPPLATDSSFTYEVRAAWTQGGQEVSQTRRVVVRAGDNVTVEFGSPTPEQIPRPKE